MARSAPLAWRHAQASPTGVEGWRRRAAGWAAIRARIVATSAAVTGRPRWVSTTSMRRRAYRRRRWNASARAPPPSHDPPPQRRRLHRREVPPGQQHLQLVGLERLRRVRAARLGPEPEPAGRQPLVAEPVPAAVADQELHRPPAPP